MAEPFLVDHETVSVLDSIFVVLLLSGGLAAPRLRALVF
jgi:hypothetical protein